MRGVSAGRRLNLRRDGEHATCFDDVGRRIALQLAVAVVAMPIHHEPLVRVHRGSIEFVVKGQSGGSVVNADGNIGRVRGIPRAITRDGREDVRSVRRRAGIPVGGIRRSGIFRAERVSIQQELHAGNSHIVRGGRADGDGAGHGASASGRGESDGWRCRVRNVIDGDGKGR